MVFQSVSIESLYSGAILARSAGSSISMKRQFWVLPPLGARIAASRIFACTSSGIAIPEDVQAKILDAAIRAPSGGNTQNWRFMLIDDPALRAKMAPLYKDSIDTLWKTIYKERIAAANAAPDSAEGAATLTMQRSAQWLADNFEVVPLWLFAFVQNDGSGGSIYPAVWSA